MKEEEQKTAFLMSRLPLPSRGRGGARELRRLIQNEVEAPLADTLLGSDRHPAVRVSGDHAVLQLVCES